VSASKQVALSSTPTAKRKEQEVEEEKERRFTQHYHKKGSFYLVK
jgi:hypothetical protein